MIPLFLHLQVKFISTASQVIMSSKIRTNNMTEAEVMAMFAPKEGQ